MDAPSARVTVGTIVTQIMVATVKMIGDLRIDVLLRLGYVVLDHADGKNKSSMIVRKTPTST